MLEVLSKDMIVLSEQVIALLEYLDINIHKKLEATFNALLSYILCHWDGYLLKKLIQLRWY